MGHTCSGPASREQPGAPRVVLPGGALCLPSVTRYGHKQLFLIQKTDALIHVPDNGKAKETISCSFQRSS